MGMGYKAVLRLLKESRSLVNDPQSKTELRWWMPLVLGGFGVALALAAVLVFLAVFPQFRPDTIIFRVKQGDIFFHTPEWVRVPENPDEILSIHWLAWDGDGFRVPARRADRYPILALGDSFTEAANVGKPWPDVLAEALGQPVRNLGFRGYGPVEEARILELYGANSGAEVVIVGFFEGNDLSNAVTADPDNIVLPSQAGQFEIIATDLDAITERDERYPMRIAINGEAHDIVFFEGYLWWLNGATRAFERSLNVEITAQSWRQMRATMPDACLIVAYFPAKPHIYLPYLLPEYHIPVMREARRMVAGAGEAMRQIVEATDYDTFLSRLGNQRDALAARAAAEGVILFDTTPALQAAAAEGELLYYTYDTHWNQRGHEVVGQALADFMADGACAGQD